MNTPGPTLAADLAHLGMQVTPQNIVQVANVLRAEAEYLTNEVDVARVESHVGEPGEDPVSRPAAIAFNAKIDAMYDRVQEYIDLLRGYSDRLLVTARGYGHTDDAIQRSFKAISADYGATDPTPGR